MFGVEMDVILLGIVSFLTDVSSEMIFSVFATFFTVILGASAALLGTVEGLADTASCSLDYVAGYFSDKSGKRKPFTMLGYGFSTLAKLVLLFANSVSALFAFRVVERLGKSFRGPPRDAWIASIARSSRRGYAFGLHKAFDKAGAVLGPLIAFALLYWLGQSMSSFRLLFIIAIIPALLSVIVLAFISDKPSKPMRRESPFASFAMLGKGFKKYLFAAGIFSLAYFSFGFLLLKAYSAGFSLAYIPLLYALFNLSFVIVSPLVGMLGDRIGRKNIIALSYIIYFLMCIGFIFAQTKLQVAGLFVVFGIFYAIDEAQAKAFISDLAPSRRATAIGVYNVLTGIIYLPASLIAGGLWVISPNYSFAAAALIALVALAVFLVLHPSRKN